MYTRAKDDVKAHLQIAGGEWKIGLIFGFFIEQVVKHQPGVAQHDRDSH
jgi:hypothetical protein